MFDKKVTEFVVTGDFHPSNENLSEPENHTTFGGLHALSTYLNFFYLRKIHGGQKRKSRKACIK